MLLPPMSRETRPVPPPAAEQRKRLMTLPQPAPQILMPPGHGQARAPYARASLLLVTAAILAGIGLRFVLRFDSGFWEDEIIAVTHAVQPLPYVVVNVLRYDVHPPLYFLQLHLWSLVSHADLWFVANSVAWGVVAVASLFLAVRQAGGAALGWTAAAFLSVLPSGLWMSQEVRPYAWLSVLCIAAYALALRCFGAPVQGRRLHAALLALCLLITWSHAIGFLAVLFNGLFALGLLVQRRAQRRDLLAWLLVYGSAALASLPLLASNLLHDANIGGATSLRDALSWLPAVIYCNDTDGAAWWLGLLAYAGITGFGLANPRTRLMSACFLAAPLLVAGGLALGLKPVFKSNFFATLLAPPLAIVLAELTLPWRSAARTTVAAGLLAGLLAMSVAGWSEKRRSTDFLPAADDLRTLALPGDAIYVPQASMFWGLAWYLAGPDWGSPLEVASQPSMQWQHVYARLGARITGLLHLTPTTQVLELPGQVSMIVGDGSEPLAEAHRRVWLVTYQRADLPEGYPPSRLGALERRRDIRYSSLVVSLYEIGK